MSGYKLHYFNVRAKGELIRLTFAAAGVEFEDVRYRPPVPGVEGDGLEWNDEAKAGMPLGQLPVLEVDGQKFAQSAAIARFVAKKHGLMGADDVEALKVDMVLETMWPDVAAKCFGIFWEKDEEKKTTMKEGLGKSIPVLLKKVANWIKGDFFLGANISLADLAILDAMSIVDVFLPGTEVPEAMAKVLANAKAHAGVKKWLETRPKTDF